jgi:hypothetical protein
VRSGTRALLLTTALAVACAPDPEIVGWRAGLGAAEERSPEAEALLHPVHVHVPPELSTIATVEGGAGVACATCHSIEGVTPPTLPAPDAEPGGPHAGLHLVHGTNTCGSCHDAADPTSLRLADGMVLPMVEARTLCAQCHGPQHRDYQHGSHGGMRGHWDRTRGPRERNHCVDCHDPHAPRYPRFLPMPPPRDRIAPVRAHAATEAPHE